MDEGVLCEVGKVDRGMVCEKSRGSGDAQEGLGLWGDRQRKVRALWQGGSTAGVEVGTSLSFPPLWMWSPEPVAASHPPPLPQTPGHGALHPFPKCSSSTQLEAGALAAKLKWVLWLQTPRPSDLFFLLFFFSTVHFHCLTI